MLLYIPSKGQITENTKKQFKIPEKVVYVKPDEIFKAFVGTADDLTMNDNEYLQLIERSGVDIYMLHNNTRPLLFVIILLNHSAQSYCNVETSPLIYTVNYCKLNSAKNAITHMLFVMLRVLLSLSTCQLVFMTFFSSQAQNLEF